MRGSGKLARKYDEDTFHVSKEADFIVKAKSLNGWLQNVAPDSRRDLVLDVWRHGILIIPYNVLPAECCQGWLKGFAVHRHFALSGGRQEAEGLGSPLLYLGLPTVDMDYTEFFELYIERGALLLKVCFERTDALEMVLRDLTTLTISLLDIALAIHFRQDVLSLRAFRLFDVVHVAFQICGGHPGAPWHDFISRSAAWQGNNLCHYKRCIVNLYSVIIQEVGDGLVAREDDDTFHASKEVDLIVKGNRLASAALEKSTAFLVTAERNAIALS
ncbi:hypothetical protein Efla_007021 [Eimeria flavescens]